jgi:septum formation protein
LRLSIAKAQAVQQSFPEHYILAADTVVGCGRRILPKAETPEQARYCLEMLSGRRHHVYGGIALIAPQGRLLTKLCDTVISFKRLTPQDIEDYIQSGEWDGKAGGYGVQGYAGAFVKFMRGSYSNVVGLSIYDTLNLLKGSGYLSDEITRQ